MKKKLLIVITALVLAVSGCSIADSTSSDSDSESASDSGQIDLNDYLIYEFTGYDGDGIIEYSIDIEGIKDANDALSDCRKRDLEEAITGSWDRTGGLSNGDTVEFNWNVHVHRIEADYGVEFLHDDLEVEVEGLESKPEFDPFDYFEISITGISPVAQAVVPSAATPIGTIIYTLSESDNLSNGDVITVTASMNEGDMTAIANEQNYSIARDTMEITVEGLDEYAVSMDDLTDETISAMQEQAMNVFYANTDWAEDETINSLDYNGMYFLHYRDGATSSSWDGRYNKCYIVLAVNVSNSNVSDIQYYYYVEFHDLIRNNDGTTSVDISDFNYTEGSSSWLGYSGVTFSPDEGHYYVGYETLDDLYTTILQTQFVDYTCESTYG